MRQYWIRRAVLMAFFFLPFGLQAQDSLKIGLEKLLDTAIASHPYILSGNLQTDIEILRKEGSFTMPKTDFQFLFGNINDAYGKDYLAQVTQNFPFPSLFAAQKSFAQSKVEAAEEMKKLRILEVKRNIRRSYWAWCAASEKEKVWREQVLLLQKITKIALTRFEAGESDLAEKNIAELQLEQAANELSLATAEKEAALAELQRVSFLPQPIAPMGALEKVSFEAQNLNNPLIIFLLKNIEAAEKRVLIERRKSLPDLMLGYYTPSFAGINRPYSVGIFGVSLPIFYTSFRKNIQIAKKEIAVAQNELSLRQNDLQRELEAALAKRKQIFAALDNTESKMLPNAQKLIELSEKRYRGGETDFLYVGEMRKQALQTRLNHVQLLWQYNTLQTDLMFLAGE